MATTGRSSASRGGPEIWGQQAYEVWFLGTNAVGSGGASTNLTSAQSFATIAGASNAISIDGTASYWYKTASNTAHFAYPQQIFIQCSAPGAGTNQGTFTITGRNQFDETVVEKITYASGTSTTVSSKTCWRYIESITFINDTATAMGDTTATVSVGWKASNNSSNFPMRVPAPFKLKTTSDFIEAIVIDAGGGTLGITPGGAAGTPISMSCDTSNHVLSFQSGAITTQPTAPMRFLLIPNRDVKMYR